MASGGEITAARRRLGLVAAMGLVVAVSAGCSGDQPGEAARAWVQAVAASDGNKIGSLTCASEQGDTQFGMGVLAVVNWLGGGLLGEAAEIDISDLEFKTTTQANDAATVQMTGQLRAAILGIWQSQEVSSTLRMVVEDGRWKYCGST